MKKNKTAFLILSIVLTLLVGMTPQKVMAAETVVTEAQVKAATEINILDYESNTKATEYVITDVAGMEKLAELVNDIITDFTGKTIILKNDLQYDKNVVNNHEPIGTDNLGCFFNGTFDGKGYVISGLNTNGTLVYSSSNGFGTGVGLFGFCGKSAVIRNVRIVDSVFKNNVDNDQFYIGGIAAISQGAVQNCVVDDTVKIICEEAYSWIGGIVGENNGEILNCQNYADIKGTTCVGGICGGEKGTVKYCVNYGNIIGEEYDGVESGIGGIIGYSGKVYESCNFGSVRIAGEIKSVSSVGGIVGYNPKNIINCFNSGEVISEKNIECSNGSIVGMTDEKPILSNCYAVGIVTGGNAAAIISQAGYDHSPELKDCYWLTGIAEQGIYMQGSVSCDLSSVYEYTSDQMKSDAFVEELNANSIALGYGAVWEKDTENINNGYPILKNVPYTEDPWDFVTEDEEISGVPVPEDCTHLFKDYKYQNPLAGAVVRTFVNGGKVKKGDQTIDYKNCSAYTDILASYIYNEDAKGKVKSATGKVIAGITMSTERPKLENGKIIDQNAEKIAKAKVKNGVVTVTANKEPGLVYLWLMDTGNKGIFDYCPVNVLAAPSKLKLYDVADSDSGFKADRSEYKKDTVSLGKSVKVYLYPTYGEKNNLKKTEDATYTVTIDDKAKSYFTVQELGTNCYQITATGLNAGKPVSGKITFTCKENGKKAAFTVTAVNPVTAIDVKAKSNMTANVEVEDSLSMVVSEDKKVTGSFELDITAASSSAKTTDAPKLYLMSKKDGFDAKKLEEGKVSITAKPDGEQKKLTAKLDSDKKSVTVTANRVKAGTTVYCLVVYNTKNHADGCGYKVVELVTK